MSKHKCSQSHISAEYIIHRSTLETMDLKIIKASKLQYEITEKFFDLLISSLKISIHM